MRKLFIRLSAILTLLLCSQALYGLLHPAYFEGSLESVEGDLLNGPTLIFNLTTYVCLLWSLMLYYKKLPKILLRSSRVLLFPTLAMISTLWSMAPALTIRRSCVLAVVTIAGMFFAEVFSIEEMCRLITLTSLLICLVTLSVSVVRPEMIFDATHAGAWKGLFMHKNVQAAYMCLALICCLYAHFRGRSWIKPVAGLLILTLLLLSRSATSIVALLVGLAFIPFVKMLRASLKLLVVSAAVLAVACSCLWYLLLQNEDVLVGLIGKDMTLTGRTQLWPLVLVAIAKRPLLGYGYNAFWTGPSGESFSILAQSGWMVPHAHNGFLDVMTGMGILGLATFLLLLADLIRWMYRTYRLPSMHHERPTAPVFWPLVFLALLLNMNLTETVLSANSIYWLLFVFTYATMRRYTAGLGVAAYTGSALQIREAYPFGNSTVAEGIH